jgi:hypothetical protein
VIARSLLAIVAVAAVGTQVVRNAAVTALADTYPVAAVRFWSGHPEPEVVASMTEIARAARDRRPVPAAIFGAMNDVAAKDPLTPEPFLVRGVRAQLAGDGAIAQRAFEAAQWRDPRSLPAAYFLADRYFRTGDLERGLNEVAALARVAPNGSLIVAPYVAAYARDPANWPALRRLFHTNAGLADSTLIALATKIETAPAVLALADPHAPAGQKPWLQPLLNTMTNAGQYAKAHAIWASAAGVRAGELLHDPYFADRTSLPPFNWALTSSTVGTAERQPGGRLHVIFYGQEDGFLASQLLVLPPGAYRLSMQLLGEPQRAHALSWSVWCDKATAPLASMTLDAVAARGLRFQVPGGCAAQWIRLAGVSSDMPQQSDVVVVGLSLEKAAPGA